MHVPIPGVCAYAIAMAGLYGGLTTDSQKDSSKSATLVVLNLHIEKFSPEEQINGSRHWPPGNGVEPHKKRETVSKGRRESGTANCSRKEN